MAAMGSAGYLSGVAEYIQRMADRRGRVFNRTSMSLTPITCQTVVKLAKKIEHVIDRCPTDTMHSFHVDSRHTLPPNPFSVSPSIGNCHLVDFSVNSSHFLQDLAPRDFAFESIRTSTSRQDSFNQNCTSPSSFLVDVDSNDYVSLVPQKSGHVIGSRLQIGPDGLWVFNSLNGSTGGATHPKNSKQKDSNKFWNERGGGGTGGGQGKGRGGGRGDDGHEGGDKGESGFWMCLPIFTLGFGVLELGYTLGVYFLDGEGDKDGIGAFLRKGVTLFCLLACASIWMTGGNSMEPYMLALACSMGAMVLSGERCVVRKEPSTSGIISAVSGLMSMLLTSALYQVV